MHYFVSSYCSCILVLWYVFFIHLLSHKNNFHFHLPLCTGCLAIYNKSNLRTSIGCLQPLVYIADHQALRHGKTVFFANDKNRQPTKGMLKVKNDHHSKFSNLSNLSNWKEAWKKTGLQRDSNPRPPRYQCNALLTALRHHTLGARSICWVNNSHEEWNGMKYIWNNLYVNCGGRCKWRMIMAVNFPI